MTVLPIINVAHDWKSEKLKTLDIVTHAGYWLRDENGNLEKKLRHICWDGCMFPNDVMTQQQTWNDVLRVMTAVRDAHGWD